MKALGTGIRGIPWRSIEVIREKGKAPTVFVHGYDKVETGRRILQNCNPFGPRSKRYLLKTVENATEIDSSKQDLRVPC